MRIILNLCWETGPEKLNRFKMMFDYGFIRQLLIFLKEIDMKELNVKDLEMVSGGVNYKMRPMSHNVEDRRGMALGGYWWAAVNNQLYDLYGFERWTFY